MVQLKVALYMYSAQTQMANLGRMNKMLQQRVVNRAKNALYNCVK